MDATYIVLEGHGVIGDCVLLFLGRSAISDVAAAALVAGDCLPPLNPFVGGVIGSVDFSGNDLDHVDGDDAHPANHRK